MNENIIDNLYQLWSYIGRSINSLNETSDYSTVSVQASDWPNRVFNVQIDKISLSELVELCYKGEIPEFITVPNTYKLGYNSSFDFVMRQKNMAINLNLMPDIEKLDPNIKQVKTKDDALKFAETASKSFSYKVDSNVVNQIIQDTESIRLFIYETENMCLACGLIFFDSRNIAGLHMIGTLPEGRGKGIGKSMTERLLHEAKINQSNYCVLHASAMGEKIYKKLGFKTYGEIETYKILH